MPASPLDSEEHYGRALAVYREIGDRYSIAASSLAFGRLRIATNRNPEACEHLTLAADLFAEIGIPYWEQVARDLLATVRQQRDSAQAATAG